MRLTHVLVPAPIGGLERVVQMLAVAQREAGHTVSVVAVVSHGQGGAFVQPLADAGVECRTLLLRGRASLRELNLLSTAFREIRPDVVHTHGYRADVVGGLGARRVGVPVVSTAHGFTGGSLKNRFYEWLQTRSYRDGRQVVAVSRPLEDRFARAGVRPERLHLIRNALGHTPRCSRERARERLGIAAKYSTIAWIGRLTPEKGPDLALEAVALTDARLSLLGDGPMRGALENRARRLGIEHRIRWHGWVEGAGSLLPAFDAVLISSRTEGTPIVALEAMAAGVPLVATSVGGIPDIATHEREALLAPIGGGPAELARCLQRILDDPGLARRLTGQAVARIAEEFDPRTWVGRYDRVYRRATGTDVGSDSEE